MISKLPNYSRTLLILFVVANVSPTIVQTLPTVKFDNWTSFPVFLVGLIGTAASLILAFFTDAGAMPEPMKKDVVNPVTPPVDPAKPL